MPEGPEIRIAADRLAAALRDQRLEDVFLGPSRLVRFRTALLGARVLAIDTHGKAMLTRFDNGLTLYSHNQLYGRWYVRARGELPNTNRSLRIALHTNASSAFLYSATDIDLLTDSQIAAHPFLSRLGPDILDFGLTWRVLARRLHTRAFRGRALGSLYLDQSFAAGIGNYLRSEILFFAGQNPAARPKDLTRVERNRLARQTLAVGQRAYATQGVTNSRATVRRLKAEGKTYGAYRYAVFGREGSGCYACGHRIRRMDVASRRLYFCPHCQRQP